VFALAAPRPARGADSHALSPAGEDRYCTSGNALCVRGTFDPTGTRMVGDVAIETPLGDWMLTDADLVVDLQRPMLAGTASVGLPTLGFLDGMASARSRATVHIGFGGDAELLVADRPFTPSPDKFYVAADLESDAVVSLGGVEMFRLEDGTSLLFEPTAPIIYADGATATFLGAAIGLGGLNGFALSLDREACIPYTTKNKLLDRRSGTAAQRSICGNLWIDGTITYEIVEALGEMLVDLDADDDGVSVFEGQPRDFAVVGDTATAIALPGVPRALTLARTSYLYEGNVGSFGRFSISEAQGRDQLFAASPLAGVLPGADTSTSAVLDDAGQWVQFHNRQSTIGGWPVGDVVADVVVNGSTATFGVTGRLGLPSNTVTVTGTVATDGAFRFTAHQDLALFGLASQDAEIILTNNGVIVSGEAQVRGPQVRVDAMVTTRRDAGSIGAAQAVGPNNFALTGKATIKLHGQTLADGAFYATASQLRVKGTAKYAGAKFKLDGKITPTNFALGADLDVSASKKIDFGVKTVKVGADGEARFRISDESFSVKFHGDVDPGGTVNLNINGDGAICQKFKVSFGILGSASKTVCLKVL
jgi:hypothetical protein